MNRQFSCVLTVLSLLLCTAHAAGKVDVYVNPLDYIEDSNALEAGDPAPALVVKLWLGDPPIEPFQPGTIYVVEYMASWCAPCQKSLPHLSELADRYRDSGVQFIGVAAAEQDGPEDLRELIRVRGDSIRFPIAFVEQRKVYEDWMEAGRTVGLPWVFLVDRNGRIAWWGQPFYTEFEPALAALVNERPEEQRQLQQVLQAEKVSAGWELARQLEMAEEARNWQEALRLSDALRQIDPQRYWWEQVQAFRISDQELGDHEDALRRAHQILESSLYDNPHALTELSELLLVSAAAPNRRAMALRAIRRASELTHGQNPAVEALLVQVQED